MISEFGSGTEAPLGMRVARAVQPPGIWAGGTTRAIYAYPPDPGLTPATALFWVGTAVIEQPAAYSFFPNRTRVHIPIHGNGIHLHFQAPAEVVALATFDQHRFDGARPVQVELVDGPVVAFNLIARSDLLAQASMIAVDAQATVPVFLSTPRAHGTEGMSVVRVVYAVNGVISVRIAEQAATRLEPADALVIHPRPVPDSLGDQIQLRCEAASAAVVAASIVFRAGA